MQTLWQDLRYSLRMLMKKPGFTAVAIITLALGIGANSAIFSVVNAVMLRPLPYKDPDRLVMVWMIWREGASKSLTSPGDFIAWRDRNKVFDGIAAYEDAVISKQAWFNLTGSDIPERVQGAPVSVDLFNVLGVQAAMGRVFLPEDEQPGHDNVVILSDGLWRRRFGADPNIIGSSVRVNNGVKENSYTVVGVMPPSFKLTYPQESELWVPIVFKPNQYKTIAYKAIARLKPDVTIEQAQAQMAALSRAISEEIGRPQRSDALITPLHDEVVGNVGPAFMMLVAAVAFVLLIACANVANLLLARATERSKEIAIRAAIGASRRRLFQQLLTESLMLSLIGGALGLLMTLWSADSLVAIIPSGISRANEVSIDGWALGFTLAVSILTGIIFGLIPALQASKPDLNEQLKEGSISSTTSRRARRIRGLLVVAEFAMAMVLLVGAGLMIRSLWGLHNVELGFEPEKVLTARISLPMTRYREDSQRQTFFQQLSERVSALPGVEQAGITSTVPLKGADYVSQFEIEGRSPLDSEGNHLAGNRRIVDPGFFQVMGMPLLKGRLFSDRDREGAPRVAIVNEAMARKYFPDEEPIGKRLIIESGEEIVGVVGDVRQGSLIKPMEPAMYLPFSQNAEAYPIYVVARTASNPLSLADAVRKEVLAIDKDQPVEAVAAMSEILSDSMSDTRFYSVALGAFAFLALVLAVVGIYGILSYSVAERTHEIGIRMALGADQRDILKLVIGQSMALTLIGVAIGLAAAFALTRLMSSLLYGVSATDPATFIAISLLLIGVALGACFAPAYRATKVDPMIALRYE